ncbi:MAG: hypothetical protein WDN69_24865 [Aliidongia sp.]
MHCLLASAVGRAALAQPALGMDCVRHARMFFDRPDYDLASAAPGSFAIAPIDGMIEALNRDYDNTKAMIFGGAPDFAGNPGIARRNRADRKCGNLAA